MCACKRERKKGGWEEGNRGMLGFVNAAEKSAESTERGKSRKGFSVLAERRKVLL